ncbi:MAG: PQQ-binding-like beta-propeller repeat protein [Alphaproteobacteria bacterium]|nr:PQQ-binding-like beta-propeller repeat protein [Alphaproteobacteria bacterium]
MPARSLDPAPRHLTVAAACLAVLAVLAGSARAAEADGPTIFKDSCAGCHEAPEMRAPTLESIRLFSRDALRFALTEGKMQAQAAGLSEDERERLIAWLGADTGRNDAWHAGAVCPEERRAVDLSPDPVIGSWGLGPANRRHLDAAAAGLSQDDLGRLEVAWVLGFPGIVQLRSQPVIVGTTLFLLTAETARVYALDTETGCLKWSYASDKPLRTSLGFARLSGDGREVLFFGDVAARAHLIDAATGRLLWRRDLALFPSSMITGAPAYHEGRLFVPISSYEISLAANPKHECCKSHGAVVALDARTGETVWTAHATEPARPTVLSSAGTQMHGPSGAPIWSSPAIDAGRGLLYVGTGENLSAPATATSDAILAMDLATGAIRWSFQATADDIFNGACGRGGANCPPGGTPLDFDFGASVVIAKRSDGSDLLLAGQKSGTVWALDPAREGALVWKRELSQGTALGGVHWGMALNGRRLYVPVNDPDYNRSGRDYTARPGLTALDVDTGEALWSFKAEADCRKRDRRLQGCRYNYGLSAAALSLGEAVVTGSMDGKLRIFDGATGAELFQYDTVREFETANGVEAAGGTIDNSPFAAANGTLFVLSGYGSLGGTPGNALLAFRPKR